MKKFLGIIVLGFLWCNISFADDKHLDVFNKWLNDNGYEQYLDKTGEPISYKLDRSVCKNEIITQEYTTLKKCVGADGTIIPNSDLKFKAF